jgi:oxygen-dependent protoporphyrinogen oxidase
MLIGRLDKSRKEATVVGGGVSGLLAAHYLDKAGFKVELREKGERFGGMIQTLQTSYGLVEKAANSVLATPPVVSLCAELGVPLVDVEPNSHSRFIFRDGRLRKFPLRFLETCGLISKLVLGRSSDQDLTVEDWALRHLGRGPLDYLLNPFLRGIYAARPSEISLAAAFPSLRVPQGKTLLGSMISRKRSSSAGARGKMMAPVNGMESLTRALESGLRKRLGERLKLGCAVEAMPDSPNVVICTSAAEAASLLEGLAPALSSELRSIEYAPLITATVFAENAASVRGVGVLIPESEQKRECLGILFSSSTFPGRVVDPGKTSSFTMMLGGTSRPDLIDFTDAQIEAIIEKELREILGFEPLEIVITRWKRAIPIYNSKILSVRQAAEKSWCQEPGRVLFANYTGSVSLRGLIGAFSSADLA